MNGKGGMKMKNTKSKIKLIAMLLSVVLLAGMFTGCSGGEENKKDKDVVVIKVGALENAITDFTNLGLMKKMEEEIGIRFEFTDIMSSASVSLMFTSGDYPVDVLIGQSGFDSKIQQAASVGDVVELTDDLLAEHAPLWKKFFDEHPEYYAASVTDGTLLGLPYVQSVDGDRNLRDVWWINQTWLNELNLKMPTTLEEFKTVLRAFKNNAGKGSIPENVMPWYSFIGGVTGGQFDFYASYGMEMWDYTGLYVDDNGQVQCSNLDVRMKAANKELASMYKEGLLAPESCKDTAAQFQERMYSLQETPYIGVFTAYSDIPSPEDYVPMTLFTSLSGTEPRVRPAEKGCSKNKTVIFSTCKNVDKVLEAFNWLAKEENAMSLKYGPEGDGWDYDETTDTYTVHNSNYDRGTWAPAGSIAGLVAFQFDGKIQFDDGHEVSSRIEAAKLYEGHIIPSSHIIPTLDYSGDDLERYNDLRTTIFANYSKGMVRKWVNGTEDVESTWDTYVAQLKALGVEEYIEIVQRAYDNYMSVLK